MSTDDRTEATTDRAAIRDSDEPDERGDFPYYDLGPATSEAAGALDLDTGPGRAVALLRAVETIKATGGAVEISGVRIEPCDEFGSTVTTARAESAEAEARSLRAKVAEGRRVIGSLAETVESECEDDPEICHGHDRYEGRCALLTDLERALAALATGEGK